MPNAEKSARTRRTPEQIAVEELEAATKRVEKAQKRVEAAESEVKKAKAELSRAQRFADYAAQNPDLPENAEPKIDPADPRFEVEPALV